MSAVRVTYTISEDTKEKIDFFKKKYKTNISELIDVLLKFDKNSVSKMFEMYRIIEKEEIEKENTKGLITDNGYFIWDESLRNSINKVLGTDLDDDDLLSANIQKNAQKDIEKPIATEENVRNCLISTGNLIKEYRKLLGRVEELEKKINI